MRAKRRHVILVAFTLLATAAALAACKQGTGSAGMGAEAADTTGPRDISGTYALTGINGQPLPYTMTHEPPGVRVMSGSFTINPDGTCASHITFVVPGGQSVTRDVNATWTRAGRTLTMAWQGAGTNTGTVAPDSFTMLNEGQTFTYQRQR